MGEEGVNLCGGSEQISRFRIKMRNDRTDWFTMYGRSTTTASNEAARKDWLDAMLIRGSTSTLDFFCWA